MAEATKTILKLTNTEAIIKVSGNALDSTTISLATYLLSGSGSEVVSGTPKVNIAAMVCYGIPGGYATITRGGVVVLSAANDALSMIDLTGRPFVPDTTGNTSDIVVTINTQQCQVYLFVKKVSGYKSTDSLATTNS